MDSKDESVIEDNCSETNSNEEESCPDSTNLCFTDAGHPRFVRSKKTPSVVKDVYCPSCDHYFPGTKDSLREHFKEHETTLPPCQYCGNQVFKYKTSGGEEQIHHKCQPGDMNSNSINQPHSP